MKRLVVVVLLLLLFAAPFGAAIAAEFPSNGNLGGVKFLTSGHFVGVEEDIAPGWYRVSPAGTEVMQVQKLTVVDCKTFEEPKLVASYSWREDGMPLLCDDEKPEEYTVPLWEGCAVLVGYHSGLSFDANSNKLNWNQYDVAGKIRFEYVASLNGELAEMEPVTSDEAFEAAIGTYHASASFPIGVYRITCSPNATWTTVSIYNEKGKLEHSQVMHSEEGGEMGRIEIKEGYQVKIDKGAALFEKSNGGLTPINTANTPAT